LTVSENATAKGMVSDRPTVNGLGPRDDHVEDVVNMELFRLDGTLLIWLRLIISAGL